MTIFNNTGSLSPGKSVFDLSYEKKFTCDMGQLIPVMCDEVVPGDFIQLGNQAVVRFQPLVAPVLHEIYMYTHYYFVPYRILWPSWEDFISGGVDGDNADTLPTWTPVDNTEGSLWDYMGMPVGVTPTGRLPIAFPMNAYNLVWNEYYRDETLQTEVALDQDDILLRNWQKDYFTSALPWQQRGTAPALPLSGTTNADFTNAVAGTSSNYAVALKTTGPSLMTDSAGAGNSVLLAALNLNEIDFADATTFDVADLRLAFQIQKWMERNARAGVRYTEFLKAHFGVSPRDDRLQRPEYIGGSKSPVIISEVLQTSESNTTAQGTLAGHGITASSSYCGKYRATEYGLIIGLMSVMPVPAYQQGINRQWLRQTKYDFYFPEFANLSEQAIEQVELYATAVEAENKTIFGYQGRYDEMRVKHAIVCGEMRSTYDYWHLGRQFAAAPLLNDSFIQCVPRKDIFAAPSEPGLIVSFGNKIKAYRPLPLSAEPGLIDHN